MVENAETVYRRYIEDMQLDLKALRRLQAGVVDLHGGDQEVIRFVDFDSKRFVKDDFTLSLKIRNLRIQVMEAKKRFEQLFGRY